MIARRKLIGALASSTVVATFAAHAQPERKVWRIGFIGNAPVGTSPESERLVAVLMQSLGESGFVVGKNVVLERRAAEGRPDLAASIAAEFVALRVDVIVAIFTSAVLGAKRATTTIPIVMMATTDPVNTGLVASLAHPGGNITGLSDFTEDLYPKELELLRAVRPGLVRVGFIHEDAFDRKADVAARKLGIELLRVAMTAPSDFEEATASIARHQVEALLLQGSPAYIMRKELADFAIRHRLPSMVGGRPVMSGGALMSLGADFGEIFRKIATYVVKILNGARPEGLPIEQPTKVELMINLKTAKAIGLTIPQLLLLRADELIQ